MRSSSQTPKYLSERLIHSHVKVLFYVVYGNSTRHCRKADPVLILSAMTMHRFGVSDLSKWHIISLYTDNKRVFDFLLFRLSPSPNLRYDSFQLICFSLKKRPSIKMSIETMLGSDPKICNKVILLLTR